MEDEMRTTKTARDAKGAGRPGEVETMARLSKPTWGLVNGPDRSHDALCSQDFARLCDAREAVKSLEDNRCWRILKITGGRNYTPHTIAEVARGGPDEVKRLQRERFAAQYAEATA
jgi:hypothetical protein